jgi:UPF0755 protein
MQNDSPTQALEPSSSSDAKYRPSIYRSLKLLCLCLLITLALAALASFSAYRYLQSWGERGLARPEARELLFERGQSLRALSTSLEKEGLVDSAILFEVWVRLFSRPTALQAGRYRFETAQSPRAICAKLLSGEIYQPLVLQITIPEGFTQQKLFQKLSEFGLGNPEEIWALSKNKAFLQELKLEADSLEGYLYPATYDFFERPTLRAFFTRVVQNFWQTLPPRYQEQVAERGLSLHEAVIFASLIEKEALRVEEMPRISEVIWNRLKRGMPLGVDASIIYGIADYRGNLQRKHLDDITNPYNSRRHRGLPPGPIASPSTAALRAVLTPTQEGHLYYVLNPDGSGEHVFSRSLSEHNKHVRHLVTMQRRALLETRN